MKKEREEDLEANLTGEQTTGDEAAKPRWFNRIRKGILTSTADKKETPEGLWNKCPECNHICTTSELKENLFVCPKCSYHHRIGSQEYFDLIFDNSVYTELFDEIRSVDALGFFAICRSRHSSKSTMS